MKSAPAKTTLTPALRFPEFRDAPWWAIIQKWHNTVQRQNAEADRPPPKNLSGF